MKKSISFELTEVNMSKDLRKIFNLGILFIHLILGNMCLAQVSEKNTSSYPLGPHSRIYGSQQDQNGNIYVYGKNNHTPFVLKYGVNGDTSVLLNDVNKINQDLEYWHGVNDSAFVSDITIGEDSSIYVTGSVKKRNTTAQNALTYVLKIKNQDTIWSKTIVNWELNFFGATRWHYTSKIQYNPYDSCVYVASTAITAGSDHDILTMKFDQNGNLLKYHMQGGVVIGNGNDVISNILANDSFVLVSCKSQVAASGFNLLTYYLDTSLNSPLWLRNEGQRNSSNTPINLSYHSNYIYLLAETRDSLVVNPKTASLIKYSLDGNKLWRKDFNLSANSSDVPQNFSIDDNGNIAIAVISSYSQTYKKAYILLYDSTGNHLKTIVGEDSTAFFRVAFNGTCNLLSVHRKENSNKNEIIKYCNRNYAVAWQWTDTSTQLPLQLFYADSFLTICYVSDLNTRMSLWKDESLISPPLNVTVANKTPRSIDMMWSASASSTIQGFYILRGMNKDSLNNIDTLTTAMFSYTDNTVEPSTRYYYQIAAFGIGCGFCPSHVFSDSTPFNTSIHSLANTEVWIFPNPASDDIHISTTLSDFEYTLYDISGKIKLSGQNTTKLKVQHLQAGIYFLSIKATDQQIHHFKIIKL